jgi:transposase
MMGIKSRCFQPIDRVTLEDLVSADHFYRHVDRTFDLAFVRDLVADHYAAGGRPSIDPVVFFKLQLVLFFEGLRSERQLMAMAADRLSIRWYLGYDLDEPLPDHSSLTRIRQRFGLTIFRRFFEHVLDRCDEIGLIWGREVLVDATKVPGNADVDSLVPRLKDVVDDHLVELFGNPSQETVSEHWDLFEECRLPPDRPLSPGYERLSHRKVSRTDPDATPMTLSTGRTVLGYQDHYLVDGGRARIILNCLVLSGDVMENQPFLDQFRRTLFRRKLRPKRVIADTKYSTIENVAALDAMGITTYMPLRDWEHKTAYFGAGHFTYDPEQDVYRCPEDHLLRPSRTEWKAEKTEYQADAATCNACPLKASCTSSDQGRQLHRSFHAAAMERVKGSADTPAFKKAMRKRRVWVEPLFAEAKQWHGLSRCRLRGVHNVNIEGVLIAAGQNLKRYLAKQGWGHRWGPNGRLLSSSVTENGPSAMT